MNIDPKKELLSSSIIMKQIASYMKYMSTDFCAACGAVGNLELMKFARDNGSPWDYLTTQNSFINKNFDCFIYSYSNYCPLPEYFYDDILDISLINDDPSYMKVVLNHINMDDDFIEIDYLFVTKLIQYSCCRLAKYMIEECNLIESFTEEHVKLLDTGKYVAMAKVFNDGGLYSYSNNNSENL
jgi:hypothetical protein